MKRSESVGKRVNSKNELIGNCDLYREKVLMVVFDQNWSVGMDPGAPWYCRLSS
jgi:hypothetical protein